MEDSSEKKNKWKWVFFALLPLYCLYYAPFGINETDGGFLTGLAWQVLQGKILYQDIIYVRPPLPVWSRALEMWVLPESFAVLGERYIFYLKVWLYSWMAARLLSNGVRVWYLAVLGFVVSAHCYPAMAWHTVDGIFWAVLSLFLLYRRSTTPIVFAFLSGLALAASLLCKQSFYPLAAIMGLAVLVDRQLKGAAKGGFFGGLATGLGIFYTFLLQQNLLDSYLKYTNGAASTGQAIQHGLLDYFLITPELALPSVFLLGLVWWWRQRPAPYSIFSIMLWAIWILGLVWSFAAITWLRQEHTAPFAQTRALFWLATGLGIWHLWRSFPGRPPRETILFWALLSVSWSAAISWGYNLPLLFSTPWIWAGMQWSDMLMQHQRLNQWSGYFRLALFISLLSVFRIGYEFIYRDGRRSDMTENLGDIFPKLTGIYSDPETAGLYREYRQLTQDFPGRIAVLPAFPQADFLSNRYPELPLDWVVNRETNGQNEAVYERLKQCQFLFLEKRYLEQLAQNPELQVTNNSYRNGVIVAETSHFLVIRTNNGNK